MNHNYQKYLCVSHFNDKFSSKFTLFRVSKGGLKL